MSRELKFRVWDEYGLLFICPLTIIEKISKSDEEHMTLRDDYYHDRWIIEQYTGLKDKNGKEIYEGDIVRRVCQIEYDVDGKKVEYPLNDRPVLIEWDEAGCGWGYFLNGCGLCRKMGWAAPEEVEVIGNIHENPELIGGGE